jgi:hypothetical protein
VPDDEQEESAKSDNDDRRGNVSTLCDDESMARTGEALSKTESCGARRVPYQA